MRKRRVLVTGAAGRIGSYFVRNSHRKYQLRLVDCEIDRNARRLAKLGEWIQADITDLDRMKQLCRGMDTVLHLAANPGASATWRSVLNPNIIGTYNVFVAAKAARCKRVVFASSIHAVSGHPPDVQVRTSDPVSPGDLYGVSKCFGEAMSRYMAEMEKLSTIVLRIGAVQPPRAARRNDAIWMFDSWISERDLNQLIEKSIEVKNLNFAILHGLSDSRFNRLDISDTRQLVGYQPQDDLLDLHPQLKRLRLKQRIRVHSMSDPQQQSGIREELA